MDTYGSNQAVIQSGRIICNVEDRPVRLYNEWFSTQGILIYNVSVYVCV